MFRRYRPPWWTKIFAVLSILFGMFLAERNNGFIRHGILWPLANRWLHAWLEERFPPRRERQPYVRSVQESIPVDGTRLRGRRGK